MLKGFPAKVISVVLALCLLFTMAAVGAVSGSAKDTDFAPSFEQHHFVNGFCTDCGQYQAAVSDADGGITVFDASYIQQYLVGMKCPEGIGKPIGLDGRRLLTE